MNPSSLSPLLSVPLMAFRPAEGLPRDFFALGETLPVQLLRLLDARQALVLIKGKQFLSDLPRALPAEAEFQVRVEQVQPQVLLRLIPPATAGTHPLSATLKALLVETLPLETLSLRWRQAMYPAAEARPSDGWEAARNVVQNALREHTVNWLDRRDVSSLKELIAFSGWNWEGKIKEWLQAAGGSGSEPPEIRDLKGLLLTLRAQAGGDRPAWLEALQPILNRIELGQLLNVAGRQPDQFLLFFPLWFPEGTGWAELLISGEGGGRESAEQPGTALLFLLHLPDLGKLRIEVRVWERRLFCRFKTADPQVEERLNLQLPLLRSGLAALGYAAQVENRLVQAEELGDSLVSRMDSFPESLVSLVV